MVAEETYGLQSIGGIHDISMRGELEAKRAAQSSKMLREIIALKQPDAPGQPNIRSPSRNSG